MIDSTAFVTGECTTEDVQVALRVIGDLQADSRMSRRDYQALGEVAEVLSWLLRGGGTRRAVTAGMSESTP